MRRFCCAFSFFCAGINFENIARGQPDSIFGVYWLLPIYVIFGLVIGWFLTMPSLTHADGKGTA